MDKKKIYQLKISRLTYSDYYQVVLKNGMILHVHSDNIRQFKDKHYDCIAIRSKLYKNSLPF